MLRGTRGCLVAIAAATWGCSSPGTSTSLPDLADAGSVGSALSASPRTRARIDTLRARVLKPIDPACADPGPGPAPWCANPDASALPEPQDVTFKLAAGGRIEVERRAEGSGRKTRVQLPLRASGAVRVEDESSGVSIEVALQDASDAPVALADGLAWYTGAGPGGADLIQRAADYGTEDFLVFDRAPDVPEVRYRVDVSHVPGLRFIEGVLEFLDATGDPRLHMTRPTLVDAARKQYLPEVRVEGCRYDDSAQVPWDRPVTAPGSKACVVVMSWHAAPVAYPAVLDPWWKSAGTMINARYQAASVVRADGKVLVSGGNSGTATLRSAEVYTYASGGGSWAATGSMGTARQAHTLTLSPGIGDTRILAAGGYNGAYLLTAEMYDGSSWTPANQMNTARRGHTATSFAQASGPVVRVASLIAGGQTGMNSTTAAAEEFRWSAGSPPGTWTPTINTMSGSRGYHIAANVEGDILVAGGMISGLSTTDTAEVYIPAATAGQGTWKTVGGMSDPRFYHAGVKLLDGRVLVTGGQSYINSYRSSADVFVYNGSAHDGWFDSLPSMGERRYRHTLHQLSNGWVVAAGGWLDSTSDLTHFAEMADFSSGDPATWIYIGDAVNSPTTRYRTMHVGEVVDSGRSLVLAGGYDSSTFTTLNTSHLLSLQANGQPCRSGTTDVDGLCLSSHCADHVCCNTACAELCKACSLSGSVGTCAFVPAGTDPTNECPSDPVATCDRNGLCDGAGACQLYAYDTDCGTETCSSGVQTLPRCDGAGTCLPRVSSCGNYQCGTAGRCRTSCSVTNEATDCIAGAYCDATSKCAADLGLGQACSRASQCVSGNCIDGVCCDTACAGICMACRAALKGAGSDGVCGPVQPSAGQQTTDCAPESVLTCGRDGYCNGAGACRLWSSGTSCKSPTCSGSTKSTWTCNGLGTCTASPSDCAPYACVAGSGCTSDCSSDADCASNAYCENPCPPAGCECVFDQANGAACSSASQCQSGSCVDGYCCDSACGNLCESCRNVDTAQPNGVCAPVKSGIDPTNDCAVTGGSCGQNGSCNGARGCAYVASGTPCGTTCSGTLLNSNVCNGNGTCTAGSVSACPNGYVCSGTSCLTSCTSSSQCATGYYCGGTTCQLLKADGASCTAAGQCISGYCADGYCCNSPCTGACVSCKAADTGGANGVCSPVTINTDPSGDCAPGATTCGLTGDCNGAGSCKYTDSGTSCGSTCSGNTLTSNACNGNGTCVPGSVSTCPGGYTCDGTVCRTACTQQAHCITGYYCDGSACQPLEPNGSPCTLAAECTSAHCVDGVCCETACTGTCVSCKASDTGAAGGVCAPVKIDTDPLGECTAQSPLVCGLTGNCSGTGACKYVTSGSSCGTDCTGTTLTSSVCNGSGSCVAGTISTCPGGYVCGTTSCKTSCASSSDCVPTYYCQGAACQPDKDLGQACSSSAECSSGFCVDGYCCDSACSGPCQACSDTLKGTSGKNGICGPVPANQDPQNECAQSAASTCGTSGTCNGNGACALWAPGTVCVAATCTNGVRQVSTCDGFGACGTTVSQCAPYGCSGTACATQCTGDAECIGSYHCDTALKTCLADDGNGSACTTGAQCASGNCVDGVCCDTACMGTCVACTTALKGSGADGVCGPIASASDPQNECTAQAASTCGTTGMCNGAGACALHPANTICGTTTCTGGNQTDYTCNGLGTCSSTTTPCSPFTCNGSTCASGTCSSDASCVPNYYCRTSDGTCQPDQANGAVCATGSQCASGSCVDGFCCDTACTGPCMACSNALKGGTSPNGVCGPIATGTDPQNECSAQASSTCGSTGMCNGAGACALHPQGTACGSTTCSNGWQTGQACDGAGNCINATSAPCTPYVCSGSACGTSCTSDAACIGSYYCDSVAKVCKPDQVNGGACTSASQCASGNCVDGFCCDTACSGACMACSAALKGGSSVDGVCGPIANNTDPQNECSAQASSTCGTTGMCNGAGACALYTQGTACGSTTCTNGWQTGQSCDGAGNCIDATSSSCAPYTCVSSACGSTCTTDANCVASFYCRSSDKTCQPDQANGATCTSSAQCASGSCVDGVCCDTACAGLCQACTAAKKGTGADGVCGNIVTGNDPDNECTDQNASSCGTNGSCDGNGTCDFYAAGTACGATTCSNGQQTGYACNGLGSCLPATSSACSPYVCKGSACATSCTSDGDCIAADYCKTSDHTCQPDQVNGLACTTASQCASGNCVDGVCCDTACAGVCQACTAAKKGSGTDGVCGDVMGGQDPDNECIDQGASSCGTNGACSGLGSCALYPQGTACGSTTCSGNVQTGLACNGAGDCNPSSTTPCAPYTCMGTACATTCAADTQCSPSYFCRLSDNTCQPAQPNGQPCTSTTQCASTNCVDGVCCDTACQGACMACSKAKKGNGTDGACGPITTGTDPDAECDATSPSSCGTNGSCNGAGACAYFAQGTPCGTTTCTGGSQTGKACNGSGICQDAQTTSCAPYFCGGNSCATTCIQDADCIESYFCQLADKTCEPDQDAGAPCSSGDQCKSTFCIDGVCCDTGCQGQCRACSASKKGQGTDGICGPIAGHADPDNECDDKGAPTCQENGYCNGAGACSLYPAGTACGTSTCSSGTQSGQACNGAGDCISGQSVQCSPYACSGDACAALCNSDDDCIPSYFCRLSDNTCQADQPVGAACTSASQCQTGSCADGVCCDTACAATCQACSAAKKGGGVDGVCGNVSDNTDPDNDCAQEPASTCGRDGMCNGSGECRLYGHGVSCGDSTCQGNVAKGKICDGLGDCVMDSGGVDCAPYLCIGSGCANPCSTNASCQNDYYCNQGACEQVGLQGASCTSHANCDSGFCVDGYCCDNECSGQCEACDLAGSEGTCAAVTGQPHGSKPVCGGTGDCASTCDGANRTECTFPGSAVQCAASCVNGALSVSTCDGTGHCAAGPATSCAPYVCESASECKTSCQVDDDCQGGAVCSAEHECAGGGLPDGSAGTGGEGGSGGSGGGTTGGSGGSAGNDAGTPPPATATASEDSGGCGCRVASAGGNGVRLGLMALLAAAVLARRARRSASSRHAGPR